MQVFIVFFVRELVYFDTFFISWVKIRIVLLN